MASTVLRSALGMSYTSSLSCWGSLGQQLSVVSAKRLGTGFRSSGSPWQRMFSRAYQDEDAAAVEDTEPAPPAQIHQVTFDQYKMMQRNEVTVVGNLGSEIVLRTTSTGKQLGTVNLALNQEKDVTTWMRLVLWGDAAERAQKQLQKGNQVWVRGKIGINSYEDRNGVSRQSVEITVRELHIVGKPDRPGPA